MGLREILEEAGAPTARGPVDSRADGAEGGPGLRGRHPDDEPVHITPDDEPVHITPDDEPVHITPDDEPVHVTPDEEPVYATRAEVKELARQIRQLAETQTRMLGQLSEAVALLAEGGKEVGG